ncbi:hypothetical protein GP486_004342 [Trichoglossum hirsutum]|uniref:Large ribosomal subunit protein uL6 alpha-beta domain-containing protein n=1 Tax=Trichoglossum hirsutum TaxID=265104 RepID=A0A9P8LB61_9PEZI|nr:hypothetical protein GP486_004342 [Trichoglossum hirsutum]
MPVFQPLPSTCSFSCFPSRASQIGRAPISIPPEVSLQLIEPLAPKHKHKARRIEAGPTVEVEGPLGKRKRLVPGICLKIGQLIVRNLGKLALQLPPFVRVEHDTTTRKATVRIQDADERHQREMWGTTRAYLQNHVFGVSEGHTAILRLVGVGYRATIEKTATTVSPEYPGQEFVSLKVGYSHPIELGVPLGVKAGTPQPTRILLEGCDKEVVMQFAAKIRAWRVPEPYKGKGIFVNGETIKLKAKKIK